MVVPSFNCITCYNNRTAVAAPAAIRNSFAQIPFAQNLKATCQTWSIVNHKKLCICWPPTSAGNRERAFVTMEDHFARSDTSLSSKISPRKILTTSNHLRHVDSIANLPSGAGKIPRLNAVILGEALASEEDDLVFPNEDFSRQAHVSSPQEYLKMYQRSVEDPSGFWADIASQFYWKEKWDHQVCHDNLDIRKGKIHIEWFKGGITNICYNCLDRNIESGNGDKIAIWKRP
nr:acetyl-coenzyme A synthetase, chloroplastic/glyoxysomal-like isoform X3 [Ipomoea batatas]